MSKVAENARSIGLDQRAQLPSSGVEFRKGGNVLSTSDPKAPAPNPFVQAQNQGPAQGKSPAQGVDSQSSKSN